MILARKQFLEREKPRGKVEDAKKTKRRKRSSLFNMKIQVGLITWEILSLTFTAQTSTWTCMPSTLRPYLSLSCKMTLIRLPAVSSGLNLPPAMSTFTAMTLNWENRLLTDIQSITLRSHWSPSQCLSTPLSLTWQESASLTSWASTCW